LKKTPIRPLVVMDQRTCNPTREIYHLRMGNDRMLIGFNESQKVYFSRELEVGKGMVFLTGRTPHGSLSVPGEECLASGSCTAEEVEEKSLEEIKMLWKANQTHQWTRESLEMRCVILVFPERFLEITILFVSGLLFMKLFW
jgi:hypothetical protein